MVGTSLRSFAHPTKLRSNGSLPHRDREAAEIGVRHQADLMPRQFKHRALLVAQHDRARTAADRKARAGCAVDAGDVGGTKDVADAAAQHRLRAAEHQAVIEAAGRQRITAAMEVQHAAAAGTADDPARLVDRELHKALVGMRGGGQRDAGQGRKSKHGGTNGGYHLHGSYLRRSCKSEVSAGFAARMSRNYRIVTDRRKGQSAFGGSRDTPRTPAAPCARHNFITIARTKNAGL